MIDAFEQQVRDRLQVRARADAESLASLNGFIEALPARQQAGVDRRAGGVRIVLLGLTAAAIVVLAVLFVRASHEPSVGSPSANPSPTGIVLGPNGLPVSIDDEAVLDVQDAGAKVDASTNAESFLVSGWLDYAKAACPLPYPGGTPLSTLLDTGVCEGWPALLPVAPYAASGAAGGTWNGQATIWPVFLPGTSPSEPFPPAGAETPNLAVVLRVHTHDPAAAACPLQVRSACEMAVVVDAVLWTSPPLAIATPDPSPTIGATPVVSCGDLDAADCPAAASAVLVLFAGLDGPAMRLDLGSGVFCPTPGLLFADTTCPAGAMPPPSGGQWIGHALVTLAGSNAQDYFNLARNGQVIRATFIALATPPPATPGPS